MGARLGQRPRSWTPAEKNVLLGFYEGGGAAACMERMKSLAERGSDSVNAMARKMGLRSPHLSQALVRSFTPEQTEELIRLRDVSRWSFIRIARHFGVAEATASNGYYIAMCPRLGYRLAERDENGRLLPAEIERLRTFLRKGTKPKDIQLYMGISAGCICNERRQYQRELKARGKRPLPPPGGGEAYSGAKVPPEKRKLVERLYLEGKATPEVSRETGVSKTHCLRTRAKLVKRLARKGAALPGCDKEGRRLTYKTIIRQPAQKEDQLRALLLQGSPVSRAADQVGLGRKTAYAIRDALRAELAERGEELPPTNDWRREARSGAAEPAWLFRRRAWFIFYRQLEDAHGADEARRLVRLTAETVAAFPAACERLVRRRGPQNFEERLARVRNGAGLVAAFTPRRAAPAFTLGGIASAAL